MAEAVLLVWAGFVVIVAFEFGGVSEYILMNVKDNALLTYLFQHNYLAHFVADAMPVISAFSE